MEGQGVLEESIPLEMGRTTPTHTKSRSMSISVQDGIVDEKRHGEYSSMEVLDKCVTSPEVGNEICESFPCRKTHYPTYPFGRIISGEEIVSAANELGSNADSDGDDDFKLPLEQSITEYFTQKKEDMKEDEMEKTVKCIFEQLGYPVRARRSSFFDARRVYLRKIAFECMKKMDRLSHIVFC